MPAHAPLQRLVVLYGGESAEHDVSRVTAAHALRAIDPDRYDVFPVGITRSGEWLAADALRAALVAGNRADLPDTLEVGGTPLPPSLALLGAGPSESTTVVLPLLHGPRGEDGTVQGLFELLDLAYVGPGVLGSALAMDKCMAKQVLQQAGVPQARWLGFRECELTAETVDQIASELGLPLFIKPANMGSSVGVSKANDRAELAAGLAAALRYDDWVVIEEFVAAREIEVGLLGDTQLRASVPGEIVPGAEFYDYEDKYHSGAAELHIPAQLDEGQRAEVTRLALQAGRALRVEGMARADFFLTADGRFLCNELNTIPGFTPVSMYPRLWQASGLEYPQLIDELVTLALERHRRRSGKRG